MTKVNIAVVHNSLFLFPVVQEYTTATSSSRTRESKLVVQVYTTATFISRNRKEYPS
jgi:hypothetical protein